MSDHDSHDPKHPPYLAHHFDTPRQQFESGKLGMWIFLLTEVLLFSGLFCAYAVWRAINSNDLKYACWFLDTDLGAVNTVILITSSLTMAWAVRCAQLGQKRGLVVLLSLTLLGGFGFLGIKTVEYKHKWDEGLLWERRFDPTDHALEVAAQRMGPTHALGDLSANAKTLGRFFSLYFLMTGLHGAHVIAGMIAIAWVLRRAIRGDFFESYFGPVDYVGLYWHLVDLVWIYLFPLLYLIH
ncbi:MAG: cytochrome c oxidase subunit 3 [Planctomycetota bacterium]